MTSKPLVSVVIPVFNGERFIAETIRSVFKQTYRNLELIVVNDGSTDRTVEVVSECCSSIDIQRFKLLSFENRGVCAALNKGLNVAKGEFFAYIGADDLWDARKLERQVEVLEATNSVAIFSDCYVIDAEGKILSRYGEQYPYRGGYIYEDLIWTKFQPASPTHLFRLATIKDIGGFNEEHIWEDRDLWIRITKDFRVEYIDQPLASYRIHGMNGSTGNLENMYKYSMQVIEAAVKRDADLLPHKARMEANIRAHLAASYYERLDLHSAFKTAALAVKEDPSNSLAWRTLLFSLLGKKVVSTFRRFRRSSG